MRGFLEIGTFWKDRKGFRDYGTSMENRETNNGRLRSPEIRKFKALLLAKRMEILLDVFCMENETLRKSQSDLSSMPTHMADVGTDTYEMENTLGLMDSERRLLVEIDDALGRIKNGTYGICEGNSERISKERLKAIPWARYCVACASLLEKGLLVREEASDEQDYDNKSDEQDDS